LRRTATLVRLQGQFAHENSGWKQGRLGSFPALSDGLRTAPSSGTSFRKRNLTRSLKRSVLHLRTVARLHPRLWPILQPDTAASAKSTDNNRHTANSANWCLKQRRSGGVGVLQSCYTHRHSSSQPNDLNTIITETIQRCLVDEGGGNVGSDHDRKGSANYQGHVNYLAGRSFLLLGTIGFGQIYVVKRYRRSAGNALMKNHCVRE